MQLILPDPTLSPCWEIGAISPTMYWSLPAASFTTLPRARTSKDGKGLGVPPLVSESARPVWFGDWLWACPFNPTVELPCGAANEATMLPFASRVGKSCDQVMVLAGIWRIVLQGTIILIPFSIIVPPQSIESLICGHSVRSSVADWMNPSESNCAGGVGMALAC